MVMRADHGHESRPWANTLSDVVAARPLISLGRSSSASAAGCACVCGELFEVAAEQTPTACNGGSFSPVGRSHEVSMVPHLCLSCHFVDVLSR